MGKIAGTIALAASLAVAGCSSAEPPSRIHFGPAAFLPPLLLDRPHAIEPPEPFLGDPITEDEIAALTTGSDARRAAAAARISDAIADGRALVVVGEDDVYWAVAPHLAPAILDLSQEARDALAALSGEEGERALERAISSGEPDAVGDALARHPFSRTAPQAAIAKGELLLERGELEEAALALQDAQEMLDRDEDEALRFAARRKMELARWLGARAEHAAPPRGPGLRAGDTVSVFDPARSGSHRDDVGSWRGLDVMKLGIPRVTQRPVPLSETTWSIRALRGSHARWDFTFRTRSNVLVAAFGSSGRLVCATTEIPLVSRPPCFPPFGLASRSVASIEVSSGRVVWVRAQSFVGKDDDGRLEGSSRNGEVRVESGKLCIRLDARTGKLLR